MSKVKYYGEFNSNGYEIFVQDGSNSESIYQAGNCKYDSAQSLPVGSDGSLDIATIESYCEQTGKEIANDNNGLWIGCSKVDDYSA